MPAISWILFRERVVARNSPKYKDVDNRPLRQIVELHGFDPDDAGFPGLFHFPLGLFTDDISEETTDAGVHIHHRTTIDNGLIVTDGDLDFEVTQDNAKLTLLTDQDFDLTLDGTGEFKVDGGNIRLTNGLFYGDINTGRIADRLVISRLGGLDPADDPFYPGGAQDEGGGYAELFIGPDGRLVTDPNHTAYIGAIKLGSRAFGGFDQYTVPESHKIGNLLLCALDSSVGSEIMVWGIDAERTVWARSGSISLEFTLASEMWTFSDHVTMLDLILGTFTTGGLTLNGQPVTFGAANSESAGFRNVRVPN